MIVDGHKRCAACDEMLPIEEFYKQKRQRGDGLSGYCKKCSRAKASEYSKNKRREDPEGVRAKDRARERSSTYNYSKHVYKTYGLTEDQLQQMHEDQGYACGICKRHVEEVSQDRLYVDHDHESGAVRGLLCMNCNTALGNFKDDIASVANALKWLEGK